MSLPARLALFAIVSASAWASEAPKLGVVLDPAGGHPVRRDEREPAVEYSESRKVNSVLLRTAYAAESANRTAPMVVWVSVVNNSKQPIALTPSMVSATASGNRDLTVGAVGDTGFTGTTLLPGWSSGGLLALDGKGINARTSVRLVVTVAGEEHAFLLSTK
jgi:hypothetical protein